MNSILPRVSIVDFPAYSPASNLAQVWIRATLHTPKCRFILNIADKQQDWTPSAVYLPILLESPWRRIQKFAFGRLLDFCHRLAATCGTNPCFVPDWIAYETWQMLPKIIWEIVWVSPPFSDSAIAKQPQSARPRPRIPWENIYLSYSRACCPLPPAKTQLCDLFRYASLFFFLFSSELDGAR